jgi:lipopolysaccharide assembly outer membrane protein LptD (OstA)
MGDTSFFIRYDISSIFAFFFAINTDIDIFSTLTTTTTKDYFHLFNAKIMLVEYDFNTFIFRYILHVMGLQWIRNSIDLSGNYVTTNTVFNLGPQSWKLIRRLFKNFRGNVGLWSNNHGLNQHCARGRGELLFLAIMDVCIN